MFHSSKLPNLWKSLIPNRRYSYPGSFYQFLKNQPMTEISRLKNGLTVATESRESYNTCVGLLFDAGSRYESQYNNGIAHFFEHIAFKGTTSRNKTQLYNQMTSTGAKFKCFTTREMVAYFAECLCQDVPVVTDLLFDCVYNNSLKMSEIEEQKKVVYIEMREHDQDINVLLYDYLHTTAFQGTPLAQTIVGPSSNLYNFCDSTIRRYIEKFFDPHRTVLVAVGGVTHCQVVNLAESLLGQLQPSKCVEKDVYRFTGSQMSYRNDMLPMANCAIAFEGPCFCDDDLVAMKVAAALLGGWDRSQHGGLDHANVLARAMPISHNCPFYKAFNISYKDTSLFGIQFLAPTMNLADLVSTITDEFMKLCTIITDPEVARAKRQVKTKLLTKTEGVTGAFLDIGRWTLYHGYRPPLHDRLCAIDRLTAQDIKDTCMKYLYDKCPAVAAIGPIEGLPDYNRIRSGMYWLRW